MGTVYDLDYPRAFPYPDRMSGGDVPIAKEVTVPSAPAYTQR